jgi:hypothetical protein
MRFGPFSEQDVARISPLLESANVSFTIERSAEVLAEWRRSRENHEPHMYPAFKGLVAGAFVDVDEASLSLLPSSVADFGLIAPAERPIELDAFDDFVCPKCDFSGPASSLCPRHLTPLVTFSQRTTAQKVVAETHRKVVTCLLVGALLLVLFARGCGGNGWSGKLFTSLKAHSAL